MSHQSRLRRRSIFDRDGYLVIPNLLDWQEDISSIVSEYKQLIDALTQIFLVEVELIDKVDSIIDDYDKLAFPDRFATLLGISGGKALHHLDPVLNIYLPNYRHRRDLPSAQIPALFDFICHPKLLDILNELIGSEICASPIYHLNIKLANSHLMRAESEAKRTNQSPPSQEIFYDFQVGQTNWHMDAISGLSDSLDSRIVNAWIPVTDANQENGCLIVIPGSHKLGLLKEVPPDMVDKSVKLEVKPGDVVFLDNKMLHAATKNNSRNEYRWAFNFRYLPPNQSSGRPFLPSFVARSRQFPDTELCNPYLWSSMWDRALTYRTNNGVPYTYTDLRENKINYQEAKSLTDYWQKLTPNNTSWLGLD